MFAPFSAAILLPLNHMLAQSDWARTRLASFAGKCAAISVFPMQLRLLISSEGYVETANSGSKVDATIVMTPALVGRVLIGDQTARREAKIEGDTAFAQEIAFLAQHLRWDYEEDLSKVVGDVVAHRVGETARGFTAWQVEAAKNLTENLRDYWVQERPLVASRTAIERFNREIDQLRDGTERLAKRVELQRKS
jgi:ubiquinone biosynthesis accessory factor UbiJ